MITVSDNDAASTVYARVGRDALLRIARAAGMTRFDVGFNWADALLTAHDQARLFLRIDRLAPRRHRAYLRELLGSIVSWQRWGIAPVAEERGFHIMFKGGWRIGIFHQVALLERDDRRIALAVLTSGTEHGLRPRDAGRHRRAGAVAPGQPAGRRRSLNSSVPSSSTVTTPATLGGSIWKSAKAIGASPTSSIVSPPSR